MQFRKKDGVEQVHDTYRPDKYQSWNDFVKDVQTQCAGWEDMGIDVGGEYEYGDTITYFEVDGWRPATAEDYARAQAERLKSEATNREWQERQIEQLRKDRPELFK